MGSPLGTTLANIFVGYHEQKLFSQTQKPPTYFRYVDDMFAIFDHEAKADEFLTKLNCFHPSLKFSFVKEKDKCLPQGSATFYRQRAIWARLPQQGDR